MYKVGDEVLVKGKVEIADGLGTVVYVSGLGKTFFKEEELILSDKTHTQGLADAWELAKKICALKNSEFDKIFGCVYFADAFYNFTPQEALAKIEAYEKEKEIKVGDEVRTEEGNTYWIIARNEYHIFGYSSSKNDDIFPVQKLNDVCLTKTGRTTDAIDLLRQIGE